MHLKKVKTLLLILFFTTVVVNNSHGCSCKRSSIIRAQKKSDFVFKGRLIDKIEIQKQDSIDGLNHVYDYRRVEYIFEINKVYKGKNEYDSTDQITIVTNKGSGNCGYYFDFDHEYLIYSYQDNRKPFSNKEIEDYMTTNLCTRTKKIKFLTFFEKLVLTLF